MAVVVVVVAVLVVAGAVVVVVVVVPETKHVMNARQLGLHNLHLGTNSRTLPGRRYPYEHLKTIHFQKKALPKTLGRLWLSMFLCLRLYARAESIGICEVLWLLRFRPRGPPNLLPLALRNNRR